MRDEDNKEPFAAHGGLRKPPVPPVPEQSLVLAPPPRALAPREPAEASGDMCQSHPFLWGAHMALAHSSPTRGSSGAVVMKGINTGTWKEKKKKEKKIMFCCAEDTCEWYRLLLPNAPLWNRFAFSRCEWTEVMKLVRSCKAPNPTQPDLSWGKTAPRLEISM